MNKLQLLTKIFPTTNLIPQKSRNGQKEKLNLHVGFQKINKAFGNCNYNHWIWDSTIHGPRLYIYIIKPLVYPLIIK